MLGVVVGTATQLQQVALLPWPVYAGWLTAAVLLGPLLWRRPAWRCGWLLWGAALAWGMTGWRAASFAATAMPPAWEGRDVRVTGVITDMPQAVERGMRLRFAVEQAQPVEAPPQPVPLPPQVALTWYGELPAQGLQAGQRWAWTVRLKAPHGERNPHGMDWELWWWSQGIQATGYVRRGARDAPPQWLGQTWQAPVARWRGQIHQRLQAPEGASARLQASMGVVQALVTGAQSSIGRADWQLFRDTGVAHLVSISGLHITMFAWLAMAVVQLCWRRSARLCLWQPAPVVAAWAGLALATAYALFSGWGIPAQRTIGMLAVVVLLRSQARSWPWPCIWLTVLTVVVLIDPWSLLQAGFWLSFVAVGVLFAAQPRLGGDRARGWKPALVRMAREQWIVGIALAPLTLLLFGQVSVIGLLANLWAIPWVTLVITPLSMLGVFWSPLWWLAAQGVTVMAGLLDAMAGWRGAVLFFAQPPWWAALAGVLGCLWLVMPWGWRWRMLGLPLLVPLLGWQPQAPAWGHFEVLALDVGQGSAALVRTQGHSLLFDAGPQWSEQANAGERTVVPVLRALGIAPDVLLVSHADSDHAGGAEAVVAAFPRAHRLGAGGVPCIQGQSWTWDGVQLEVLHPMAPATHTPVGGAGRNAQSCVLRVRSVAGTVALLTGDVEARQEQALLHAGSPLRADLVLMPHHGSKTSSTAAWVQAVQPAVAIAQSGYRNRFGHPHPAVVQRYQAQGARTVTSAGCGAARWRSWAPGAVQCERTLARRYWQHAVPEAAGAGYTE